MAQNTEGVEVDRPHDEHREAFARIEAEVDAGNADLSALGFWRLVREVKSDPGLTDRWADVAGRIDAKAFRRWKRLLVPVWLGNLLLVAASLALVALLVAVLKAASRECIDVINIMVFCAPNEAAFGVLLLVVAGGLSVTLHDLGHWAVGRLGGIRFRWYFLDGPFKVQPGLKTDYATYLRAGPWTRARMHAAGALVSKVAPFVVLGVALLLPRPNDLPAWSLWALLGLGVLQIATDVIWSTKKSDWKKVRRERRIARAHDLGGG